VRAYQKKKSFLVQQFLENAAEVKGEQPLSLPAGSDQRSSGTLARALPTLPSGRVGRQKSPVNEAVKGVDDPTARWHGHYYERQLTALYALP
jgi:hypothetical protein